MPSLRLAVMVFAVIFVYGLDGAKDAYVVVLYDVACYGGVVALDDYASGVVGGA